MVFHWSLSESKTPQMTRTFLSILAVLNNAVVWMVSTRSPPFNSLSPFNNPLVTVIKVPVTISMIVTFMFHFFFSSLHVLLQVRIEIIKNSQPKSNNSKMLWKFTDRYTINKKGKKNNEENNMKSGLNHDIILFRNIRQYLAKS